MVVVVVAGGWDVVVVVVADGEVVVVGGAGGLVVEVGDVETGGSVTDTRVEAGCCSASATSVDGAISSTISGSTRTTVGPLEVVVTAEAEVAANVFVGISMLGWITRLRT